MVNMFWLLQTWFSLSKEYTGQDRDDNNVQLWGSFGPSYSCQHVLTFIFGQYNPVKVAKDEIANAQDRLVIKSHHL